MDLSAWAFYLLLVLAALGAVALHYHLREPAGRGRSLLIGLRWLALALLLLLLFDPVLPVAGGTARRTAVLVDASLSMSLPDSAGETRWAHARRVAGEAGRGTRAGAGGVLLFGGSGSVSHSDLASVEPTATRSLVEPAVRAAVESGATRLLVITDGALEDAGEGFGVARRAGAAVEVRQVGTSTMPNAGLVEVDVPTWLDVGEEAVIRVAVAALGAEGDSLTVVLRRGDEELARAGLVSPAEGRLSPATLRFTPQGGEAGAGADPVRLDVALEGEDAAADDDLRSAYVRITDEPAGVALLSLTPDQEPRFLLPVLERALGVPVRGWLALPGGRFIRLGTGAAAGGVVGENTVRAALDDAQAVVLHGLADDAPGWVDAAAESARRLLVFPAAAVAGGLPVTVGPAQPGDWYPDPDIPASPVAALMAGLEPGDAPPLVGLRPAQAPEGFWSPLDARLGRRGESRPVVVAGSVNGRRAAVALGDGYWRWAFAGGAGRQMYDRLWSAVGGWLVEEDADAAGGGIEPVERVVARGAPVRFRTPPGIDSVRLRVMEGEAGEAGVWTDSVLPVRDGDAVLGVLPPGHYRYEVVAVAEGAEGVADDMEAAGPLTVERYSAEFTRPAADLSVGEAAAEGEGVAPGGSEGGRPLRASAWPYLVVVLLLCAEWALRRRWGLR